MPKFIFQLHDLRDIRRDVDRLEHSLIGCLQEVRSVRARILRGERFEEMELQVGSRVVIKEKFGTLPNPDWVMHFEDVICTVEHKNSTDRVTVSVPGDSKLYNIHHQFLHVVEHPAPIESLSEIKAIGSPLFSPPYMARNYGNGSNKRARFSVTGDENGGGLQDMSLDSLSGKNESTGKKEKPHEKVYTKKLDPNTPIGGPADYTKKVA